jgi:hypothetical protein
MTAWGEKFIIVGDETPEHRRVEGWEGIGGGRVKNNSRRKGFMQGLER